MRPADEQRRRPGAWRGRVHGSRVIVPRGPFAPPLSQLTHVPDARARGLPGLGHTRPAPLSRCSVLQPPPLGTFRRGARVLPTSSSIFLELSYFLTLQNTPGPSHASPVSALESAITPELLGSLHLRPEWGVAIAAGATALQALRVEVVMRRLTHMHMHSHMHAHTHVHTPVLIAYLPLCVRTK